ncbi:MAG: WYL domain-containing protein [Cyanobacteria bacterium RUI128]|nr:WYL domain-containing protein [Cyanobacteria bacterium RUI128]
MTEDKPRYSRLTDILYLVVLMQERVLGITLNDIRNELGVSRKTAERIRDALLDGIPQISEIETVGKEKHWGFINTSYMNEIISFSPEEIAELEAIKNGLPHDDKKALVERILSKLKAHSRKQITKVEDAIELIMKSEGVAVSQKPSYKIDLTMLDTIRKAIKENRKISCKYNAKYDGEVREKVLSPYGIIYGTNVYLIGVEKDYKDPFVYLLHRFSDVSLLHETFDKGDFDISAYASKSFGVYQNEIIKVELLFSPEVADDVLHYNFHPTQKVKQNEDGSVTVKFKASGPYEIIWHVFKWGEFVKIVSPKSLKKDYIKMLKQCLEAQM